MNLARSIFFGLTLLLALTACRVEYGTPVAQDNAQAVPSESETQSETPSEPSVQEEDLAVTPTATEVVALEPTATNTAVPTATPSPSPTNTSTATRTPSPSPTSAPFITVIETLEESINVRTGPSTDYEVINALAPGEEAIVLGRNKPNTWWQVKVPNENEPDDIGWVFADLVVFGGSNQVIHIVDAPPLGEEETEIAQVQGAVITTPQTLTATQEIVASPTPVPTPKSVDASGESADLSPEALAEGLRCGKDFCVTYQAMVPIWENGGCVGNHSIYITVLQGLPPGEPMDGVVIGDTFNNVEVASGSHGPGRTEITLWNNSMTLYAKRHINDTPYTSEESFNFTAADELIPAEVLAANGYCEGDIDHCEWARNNNQVCRGHYSWRVTFHKFD